MRRAPHGPGAEVASIASVSLIVERIGRAQGFVPEGRELIAGGKREAAAPGLDARMMAPRAELPS
jgi:hypothetical protein